MNIVSLLVLSRYADLFWGFYENMKTVAPKGTKILIRDGRDIALAPLGREWDVRQGIEPFNFARSVNKGWSVAMRDDVLLCGDDLRVETPGFVEILREVAYSDDKIGVATIQLWGQSPFVCGYFKRSVLEAVGAMDERFVGYGQEDMDWCRRMESLGLRTQPTERVKAKHGGGTSFLRRAKEDGTTMEALCNVNNKLFEEKWR
jgi:hypothetical protein